MTAASPSLPKIGEVDDLEIYVGQRGTGKSVAMTKRALDLRRKYGGAYVIGHSLGRRLPSRLPAELGGGKVPIEYHPTIEKLAKGLRKRPDNFHILAPPLALEMPPEYYRDKERATADDLIRYSVKLSTHLRIAAYRKAHPMSMTRDPSKLDFEGLPCLPIILICDEGIAVEGATQVKTAPERQEFLEWVFSLRHLHTAVLWAIQDPTARGWTIMGQATWIHVFHIKHAYAREAVRAAGASEDELDRISELYAYESVTFRVKVRKRPDGFVPPKSLDKPPEDLEESQAPLTK